MTGSKTGVNARFMVVLTHFDPEDMMRRDSTFGCFFQTCFEKTGLVDLSLTVPLEHLFLHLRHCSHLHWSKTNDFLYEDTTNLRHHSCHFKLNGGYPKMNGSCYGENSQSKMDDWGHLHCRKPPNHSWQLDMFHSTMCFPHTSNYH